MVIADDITIRTAANIILQAMKASEAEDVPILNDAWDAAHEAHIDGNAGNANDCAEAFIEALAGAII